MIRWLALILFLVAWASSVFAQAELTETYIQPGEFAVKYPAGWRLEVDDQTGFVYLWGDEVQLTLYSPVVLAAYELDNYNPETLLGLLLALSDVSARDPQISALEGGTAIRYRRDDTASSGLLIARLFRDGSVGLIDSFGGAQALDAHTGLIQHIAATFDLPPIPAPASLTSAGASWPQTVVELEASGLIPVGGNLAFAEEYVFASGTSLMQPLAQSLSLVDVVAGGSLRYRASANPVSESCGMMARVSADDNALEVGVASSGHLYASDSGGVYLLEADLNTDEAQHVLFLALDERLLVYLNGRLVADREIAAGSGHFGIRVQGSGPGATCEVTNMWAYRVPAIEPGLCEITAAGGAVNKRSGPGTQFEIAGVLDSGATLAAQTQASGPDGLVWWQLADGTWVREDVVTEQGACRSLPAGGS
jgi:hypothetical protein